MFTAAIVLVALFIFPCPTTGKDYEGYVLYEVTPKNKEAVEALKKLPEDKNIETSFWKRTNNPGQPAHILVGPNYKVKFLKFLEDHELGEPKILIKNLQTSISEERKEQKTRTRFKSKSDPSKMTMDEYHTNKDIQNWLETLPKKYKHLVSLKKVGKSFEGRDLIVLKIGLNKDKAKRAVWIDAGIHSREHITPAAVLYVINRLVTHEQKYKHLLRKIDFYIMPMANPDGYEYSRTKDRMWRRNRSYKRNQHCRSTKRGVDLNRNFPFHWEDNNESSSLDPCGETYKGERPFSAPEAQIIADFIKEKLSNLDAFITVHSYSQKILYSYSYAHGAKPDGWEEIRDLGHRAARAMSKADGQPYIIEHSAEMYTAAGVSDDWAKKEGIKYVYTFELRPTANANMTDAQYKNGFMIGQSQIKPAGREAWAGIKTIAKQVAHEA